jgi:hypothetical protein
LIGSENIEINNHTGLYILITIIAALGIYRLFVGIHQRHFIITDEDEDEDYIKHRDGKSWSSYLPFPFKRGGRDNEGDNDFDRIL